VQLLRLLVRGLRRRGDTQTPINQQGAADHRTPESAVILRTQWVPHCGRPTLRARVRFVNIARLPPSRWSENLTARANLTCGNEPTNLRFGYTASYWTDNPFLAVA
jgi:hypothetical protein